MLAAIGWGASLLSGQSADGELGADAPFAQGGDSVDFWTRSEAQWKVASARRALEFGLYDVALSLASEAREGLGAVDGDLLQSSELIALDALLAQGDWKGAGERLQKARGQVAESEHSLRRAMLSYGLGDAEGVASGLAGVDASALGEVAAVWHAFLQGSVEDRSGRKDDAERWFARARQLAAFNPALLGRVDYLIFRGALRKRTAGAVSVPQLQEALLLSEGREIAFAYAQQLAVALVANGNRQAAEALIAQRLAMVPRELPEVRAQFLLLQVMTSGFEGLAGREAFRSLMGENRFPGLMLVGLQVAVAAFRGKSAEERLFLEQGLEELIDSDQQHLLIEALLYYRALHRFWKEDFIGAERDAERLAELAPASAYRRGMLALQASAAWSRNRYRTAASFLQQLRSDLSRSGEAKGISTMIADCYFRAGMQSSTEEDFANAAEAYLSALSESRLGEGNGGAMLFQLVLSRIRSGNVAAARQALDDPALLEKAGGEMVWRSEWALAKELRRLGRVADAYDRVQELLTRQAPSSELRLRMLWLGVKLSFEAGLPEDTEGWVNDVRTFLDGVEGAGFDPELVRRVYASCLLSLADARFALEEPDEAVALLEELREGYAGYESALFSYIAQSRYFSSLDRTVDAQQLLVELADRYPQSRLAPSALFEAALNAERRGEDAFLDQATHLLQRIADQYPDSEIVYYARLKQADLLRKLNKFGSAEQFYEFLENEYADRPDRFLARLSLADTLLGQAHESPEKFAEAVSRYELLMDLPEAPLDVRVEAGYKLGSAWRSRGEYTKARQTFWFLHDFMIVEGARLSSLSGKGRYWLSRCVFALAELSNQAGDLDAAKRFYEQLVALGLPGSQLARTRLGIFEQEAAEAN